MLPAGVSCHRGKLCVGGKGCCTEVSLGVWTAEKPAAYAAEAQSWHSRSQGTGSTTPHGSTLKLVCTLSAQAPGQACGPTEGQGRGGSGDVPGLSEPWSLHREKVLTEAETGASGTQDKEQRVAATQKLERLHMEHSPAGTFISGTENTRE